MGSKWTFNFPSQLAVRGKAKEPKLRTTENTDPNVGEVPKAAKAGTKKTKQIKDKEAGKRPPPLLCVSYFTSILVFIISKTLFL